jgi:hypothetical protein
MRTQRPLMKSSVVQWLAVWLALALFSGSLSAQQPVAPQRQSAPVAEPTFDTLLAVDAYKMYGEARNVGQLLSTGGAGEIVDPILKLADPGPEFRSILNFLKKNSEALSGSRLMFAGWPTRTDVPATLVAIEFPTNEEAMKFAPKLETFLPTVLPPVPVQPDPSPASSPSNATPTEPVTAAKATPTIAPSPQPTVERLPFVITHAGNLVVISDRSFKFEKLRPASSKALFQDQNFRIAHDKFSSEPLFFYFNVQLEDRTVPKASPTPVLSDAEREQIEREEEVAAAKQEEEMGAAMEAENLRRQSETGATLTAQVTVQPSPSATPTKEQEAQQIASSQIGGLLDALGFGEPQMPEAVGLALALEGNEYVLRALLIDKPEAKRLPIPFVPQLVSGPASATEVASVLPANTEVFLSASIDLTRTYEGMRTEAEARAKTAPRIRTLVYENGVAMPSNSPAEPNVDAFTQFEKKAGFKIKDELLPALGSEIALAGSLKTLQGVGGVRLGVPNSPKPSTATGKDDEKKEPEPTMPVLLIAVKDREVVRRLLPKVLVGLGIGEANLLAQTERRGDAEMVNYAGMFAYAFVGDFLVVSDTIAVRQLIDANTNRETLSANSVYHNSRRWQPTRTLGQLYVSPALMEGYHEQIRQEAGTMDQTMRDFLLSLDPRSEAITYALSNDGLGNQHEVHLPKNLILTMVAGIASESKNPPPEQNEMIAISMLSFIADAQSAYKQGAGKGSYGNLKQLLDTRQMDAQMLEKYGYKIEVTVSGEEFEAVATPREYGKTGKRSFFVDKSGVVRGGDHGGGSATIADPQVR